jgi:ribosomal protein S18 acetylase RimI-like enzyme
LDVRIVIRDMSIDDYAEIVELWSSTEGVGLSDADSLENINTFLKRNIGLSFVAEENGKQIVGAILCGHDGRRGYLHHLAVNLVYRKNGIASQLVANCLAKLKEEGIKKCHLFVFSNNQQGLNFWNHIGFHKRNDLHVFSKDI